jgi:hypothetical protein
LNEGFVFAPGIETDGGSTVRENYSLKKVVATFAINCACPQAAVLESGDVIRRGRDHSGPVFPAVLYLRGPFGNPS